MKFFYKVDGECFETPRYYKDRTDAIRYMVTYAEGRIRAIDGLDYTNGDRFGWKLVYVEKVYFEDEAD